MKDIQKTIGRILTESQQRDAIHIAVVPVVAGQNLLPGDHIHISSQGNAVLGHPAIGIVDPYLTKKVLEGETFWMFLYPNTITSLRHDWTHPAFQEKEKKRRIK